MKTVSPRLVVVAVSAMTALILAGCGAAEDPALEAPAGSEESASFNDADVTFLQGMIPHHEQATEMAELVADRTDRDELREFADAIISDQSGEIDQMKAMLESAGADEGGGHGDMGGMAGGMDESEMTDLEAASGGDFDLMFLEMMTRHHEGAIEMAQKVLDEGQNPTVVTLARDIIKAQEAEIDKMASWQDEWAS